MHRMGIGKYHVGPIFAMKPYYLEVLGLGLNMCVLFDVFAPSLF